MTAELRALPDFVVIGGQRCGTTSLFDALSNHPGIEASFKKEVHFVDLHWDRGTRWYRANFPRRRALGTAITGEATPNYLAFPDAPRRLASVVPDAKLVVLLRDPVVRAHSAWKLRRKEGIETRSFQQAVDDELNGVAPQWPGVEPATQARWAAAMRFAYLEKSRYAQHLKRWLDAFGRDQFLVVQSEVLFRQPAPTLATIQSFLGVEVDPAVSLPRINTTGASTIEPKLAAKLAGIFENESRELATLLGQTFDWESIP